MKRIFIAAAVMTVLFSCGGGGSDANKEAAVPEKEEVATNPLEDKAVGLIAKSDCLTCHKVHEKVIGPSYTDVAAKYENTEANVAMLVEKVIKGGKGNWGEVPMTPHVALSKEDATVMVQYILSLKK
jgi:cytochrome c